MSNSLASIYCNQLDQINDRIEIIKKLIQGDLSTGHHIFDYEIACINLRKTLELIAFSSLIANKEKYAETHEKFRTQWKADLMLKNLKKINPDFYPQPMKFVCLDESGVKNLAKVEENYLTQEDFIDLHNLCGDVLHARNPFTAREWQIDFKYSVAEWVQKIEHLLHMHLMRSVDSEELWLVYLRHPESRKAEVLTAMPIPQVQ